MAIHTSNKTLTQSQITQSKNLTTTKLVLILPVYNEEKTIEYFLSEVNSFPDFKAYELTLLFVNDGSSDNTQKIIEEIIRSAAYPSIQIEIVNLSRNFGKEAALLAGISVIDLKTNPHQLGVVIPMDVDLQDPIEVVGMMLAKWQSTNDKMILAKRVDRKSDSFMKRLSAQLFYKIFNLVSDQPIEENVGDFRLMDFDVVSVIQDMPERNLFMKGLFSWPGFQSSVIEYSRPPRRAGNTKFNAIKLWNLAVEGLTSFSTVPLKIWTYSGIFIAFLSFLYASWMIFEKIMWGNPVPGYPSLIVAILFLGGVQLIGIGVIGEYVGRIYLETKNHPRFVIESHMKSKK